MPVHAKIALLGSDWHCDVRVEIDHGRLPRVQTQATPMPEDTQVDVLLPALGNLHSHAFQRAMAGMTETRAAGCESFLAWRDLMYRFLDQLTPDQIEAVAALVFIEMQEAGYAAVDEFHYVHHQPGGAIYDGLSEQSQRIFAAASQTGIGLTHLPVLYSYCDVAQEGLSGEQLRFGNDLDRFLRLVEECRTTLPDSESVLGIAPPSLRATPPTDLSTVPRSTPDGPVHIHIAEQMQEVTDVQAELGQRPVDWLLDNVDVNTRWCMIHATHMTDTETCALARSGAVAGLCPITEANLGNGIFNGATYVTEGERFSAESDSNTRTSLPEELGTLEYSQRLRDQQSVVLVEEGPVERALYTSAAQGGAQALGRDAGEIAEGKLADLVAIDRSHPTLCALTDDQFLDGLCFAALDGLVTDLWNAGRHMVQQGRHIASDQIITAYRSAIAGLLASVYRCGHHAPKQ